MNKSNKQFYVYELVYDGKVFYVGKGCGSRINSHAINARMGYTSHVCRKIRQIWESGGEFSKRKVFHTEIESDALAEEIRLISFYGRGNLTNMTDGGEGAAGHFPPPETRAKMSAAHRGKKHSKGTKRTDEQKKAMSKRQTGIGNHMYGKHPVSPNKGKPMSDGQKKKLSEWRTGRKFSPHSESTKLKMRIAQLGKRHTLESRKKMSKPRKKLNVANVKRLKGSDHNQPCLFQF